MPTYISYSYVLKIGTSLKESFFFFFRTDKTLYYCSACTLEWSRNNYLKYFHVQFNQLFSKSNQLFFSFLLCFCLSFASRSKKNKTRKTEFLYTCILSQSSSFTNQNTLQKFILSLISFFSVHFSSSSTALVFRQCKYT